VIPVNHRLSKLKAKKEKEKLLSEEELMHRSQRPQDYEAWSIQVYCEKSAKAIVPYYHLKMRRAKP
jgi:hypothetical protein